MDVEPVQKRIESVRKPSDSSAIASNHVSIASALLVEGKNIQAIGMIPCAELDEILDCLELGTICAPILLLSENLELGAADLSPARSDPLSDLIGGSWWIFIHGTSLILCRTSRPSTAGMEALIQRRTLPAVGCAVLLASLFSIEKC